MAKVEPWGEGQNAPICDSHVQRRSARAIQPSTRSHVGVGQAEAEKPSSKNGARLDGCQQIRGTLEMPRLG